MRLTHILHPNSMDNAKGPEFLNYYHVNKDIIKIYLLLSSMDLPSRVSMYCM